jgi:DNA-binding transcriptional ArsR family regulator
MPDDPKPLWNELERSIHEPARLALVTTLCAAEAGLGFQELKIECGLTDGNLSRHLKVLETAGIVRVDKAGRGRSSRTRVVMTAAGQDAFMSYLHSLEKLLQGAMPAGADSTGGLAERLSLAVS